MTDLLVKIKERLAQKDSPIRTVKGVAEAIGMSEGGFYRMLQRGSVKYGTLLALSNALEVEQSFLTGETNAIASKDESFGDEVLQRIMREMHEMKEIFEEELRAKNQQIANLQEMLKMVLGKLEGAIIEPLFAGSDDFHNTMRDYKVATDAKYGIVQVYEAELVAK